MNLNIPPDLSISILHPQSMNMVRELITSKSFRKYVSYIGFRGDFLEHNYFVFHMLSDEFNADCFMFSAVQLSLTVDNIEN